MRTAPRLCVFLFKFPPRRFPLFGVLQVYAYSADTTSSPLETGPQFQANPLRDALRSRRYTDFLRFVSTRYEQKQRDNTELDAVRRVLSRSLLFLPGIHYSEQSHRGSLII